MYFFPEFDTWSDTAVSTMNEGPPPYQQPPSYCNTTDLGIHVEDDPFDTSNIGNTTNLHRYYSQIPPVTTVYATNENKSLNDMCSQASYIKCDIANRGINYNTTPSNKNTNVVVSTTVNSPKKDIALAVVPSSSSESKQNDNNSNASVSKLNMLDVKLLEELENLNLSKNESCAKVENQVVPLLQPPPQSVKLKKVNELSPKITNVIAATLPKVQKNEISNINEYRPNYETFKKCMDTSAVVNKIWFETTVHQNGNTNTVQNQFGAFRCNQPSFYQRPDPTYDHSSYSSVPQPVYHGDSNLQNDICSGNAYAASSSFNLYSSQTAVYGSMNGRQYSEVAESVYSEIPDYFYSRVPDEILKPHRPAPPSPLVLVGPPQSMQQIQRKIQQGQVRTIMFRSLILLCCENI